MVGVVTTTSYVFCAVNVISTVAVWSELLFEPSSYCKVMIRLYESPPKRLGPSEIHGEDEF